MRVKTTRKCYVREMLRKANEVFEYDPDLDGPLSDHLSVVPDTERLGVNPDEPEQIVPPPDFDGAIKAMQRGEAQRVLAHLNPAPTMREQVAAQQAAAPAPKGGKVKGEAADPLA